MAKKKLKIIVAISGGVDSSFVAKMLLDQGNEVIGVFMRLFSHGIESERAARLVCKKLGIKFYPVNLSEKFSEAVKKYFLESYKNGRTPNPCVRCNSLIKFGELMRIKNDLGADFLATGHYARITKDEKEFSLHRGTDVNKDQSYFLYNLTQEQLAGIKFPLGELTKGAVKDLAKENKVPHLSGESQDICFLFEEGKALDHNEYLKNKINLKPGKIKTMDEKTIGNHEGLPLYTVGQRRGVKIGGTGPFYVSKLDYKTNTLYVVDDANDKTLFRKSFSLQELNWIPSRAAKLPMSCMVVIRYRHQPVECIIVKKERNTYFVELDSPQRAVTSGQSAVFYQGDLVLGGGIIC